MVFAIGFWVQSSYKDGLTTESICYYECASMWCFECCSIIITIAVTTREEKQLLKLEIKTYLDRAEEIALLSQVITLLCDEN